MEFEPTTRSSDRSRMPAWAIAAFILFCAALAMCVVMIAAGALFFAPLGIMQTAATDMPGVPAVETVPAATAGGEQTPVGTALPLDPDAEPSFGSEILQRGFTPDPFRVEVTGGGSADTAVMEMHCGFTSANPAFSFVLRGGASESFLRIYFISDDDTDSTLIVHAPQGEWMCSDNYTYGAGLDPVIEFEFGPSGEYDIWVGTHESGSQSPGSLYVTQSEQNKP
jgi:hypothetical protein